MSDLTKEEVTRRCEDLVYKVAYSFYDSPYIILLRLLVLHNVVTEKKLSEMCLISPNEVRKYLGMLHVHRLVKRYVNKEKMPLNAFQQRQIANGAAIGTKDGMTKSRDVIYWYLDYREFADVVKYRVAMMRRAIDDKITTEVGTRGYICPNCRKQYEVLEVDQLFDIASNTFLCEICSYELVEDDPSMHEDAGVAQGQDRMQRFNAATTPIRDALKSIEGARLPTLNIVAWIAQNVRTESVATSLDSGAENADGRRVDVVIGASGDEEATRARLAEEQKKQNVLPVWYTHSTVTGEAATQDAVSSEAKAGKPGVAVKAGPAGGAGAGAGAGAGVGVTGAEAGPTELDEDDALAAHYANIAADDGDDDGDDNDLDAVDLEEREILGQSAADADADTGTSTPAIDTPTDSAADVLVMVAGAPKRLADITDADEELMTPEEYEKYFEATSAVV